MEKSFKQLELEIKVKQEELAIQILESNHSSDVVISNKIKIETVAHKQKLQSHLAELRMYGAVSLKPVVNESAPEPVSADDVKKKK